MKVYRVLDKQSGLYIKIGKRTNDIYVNKKLLIITLKRYYNLENIEDRFKIIEYELVKTGK